MTKPFARAVEPLVWFDDEAKDANMTWNIFANDGANCYFTIAQLESDIWVVDLEWEQ